MPQSGPGLGFISSDYADLFRDLHGSLANKDPVELKPPFRVTGISKSQVKTENFYPMGCLYIKVRIPGDAIAIDAIARGEYMKWAITEALSESLSKITKVRVKPGKQDRPGDVLFCMDEIEILNVSMPYMNNHLWQFCDLRFDYRVRVQTAEDAQKMVSVHWVRMTAFEEEFCKALEQHFRQIYRITVMGLLHKRYSLMTGVTMMGEVELFEAAMTNDVGMIERLIQRGVEVNSFQKAERFPGAILEEELRFLAVQLSRTPLLAAAEEGHVEAMRMLLDAKADVHYCDNSGFHALYLAAGAPDAAEKAVNFLLANGADMTLLNNSGYTPLHNACGSGEVGGIRALLEAKADLNIRSRNGAAPIHAAVINDQPKSLEVLKEFNANLNLPAFGGNTPVHEGVMTNNPEIIKKLLELKADINIESGPDNDFATPLKMAEDRKKKKAAKALRAMGALERIQHEYEDSSEGEFEPMSGSDNEYQPRRKVKGRLLYQPPDRELALA